MIVTIINHFYKSISATGILFLKMKRLLVEVMNLKKIKLCITQALFILPQSLIKKLTTLIFSFPNDSSNWNKVV